VESGAPLDAFFFNGVIEQLVNVAFYDDAVSVADAAERRGIQVDRSKFTALFALRSDEEGSALERFKCWLGIPNRRYNEDWRRRTQPPRSKGSAPSYKQDLGGSLGGSFVSPTVLPIQFLSM
jgi:hypothetical protein